VRRVAEQEHPPGPEPVGDQGVEPVVDRTLHLLRGDLPVAGQQLADQLEPRRLTGRAFAGVQQELVAAAATAAGHDHVRPLGVAVVHAVALVVRVTGDVGDQPHLLEAAPAHPDTELLAHARAPAVAAQQVPPAHLEALPGGGAALQLDAVRALTDPPRLGRHQQLDTRLLAQMGGQLTLQIGLRERILERVTEPERTRRTGLERRAPGGVVVPRAGTRDDHPQHPLGQPRPLEHPQRLIIDADRLGFVAGRGIALQHTDPHPTRREQRGRGHAHRTGPDDHDINRSRLHLGAPSVGSDPSDSRASMS